MKSNKLTCAMNYIDDELISNANVITDRKRSRINYVKTVIYGLAACFVFVVMIIAVKSEQRKNNFTSHLLSAEDVKNIDYINTVSDIDLSEKNGIFSINKLEIAPGEMVIFDVQPEFQSDDVYNFRGHISGKKITYSIGYVCAGKYINMQKDKNDVTFEVTTCFNDHEIYWCVANTSKEKIILEGEIEATVNDLLFRNYSENTITIKKSSVLVIEEKQDIPIDLQAIYLLNLKEKQNTKIGNKIPFRYKVSVSGTYAIYGITESGKIIDLSEYVMIEVLSEDRSEYLPL